MEDTSQKLVKRFGWIRPEAGKTDGSITIAARDHEFSDDEWKEFSEIVGAVTQFRPYIVDYLVLTQNFRDVSGLEDTLTRKLDSCEIPAFFGGVNLIETHAICERALSNFLTSASAFVDRTRADLIETYGKESLELVRFEKARSDAYDSSFAYRLLYNLRNYSQHHAAPLNVLPISGKRSEKGGITTNVRIELQRDALLQAKMQPRVKLELVGQSSGIPLIPLVAEYKRLLGGIMLSLIEMRWDQFARFSAYAQVIVEKSGMPKGATPVVWDGPAIEQVWPIVNTNAHGFSFDEFGVLTRIMLSLKKQREASIAQQPPLSA